jgi:hypothetical protein
METIIALLMFVGVDQKLVEMTWTPSISKCLEKKRIATRNSNAVYMCSKVKAELDADNKILRIEKVSRSIFHWTWRVQVHRKYYRKKK